MKLSLAWIFDHINGTWNQKDCAELVARCNQSVAEIEGFYAYHLDLKPFSLVRITNVSASGIQAHSAEWNSNMTLPPRAHVQPEQLYLIIKKDGDYAWASMKDAGSAKEHLLPAIACPQEQQAGGWKRSIETQDCILELDNKSINHRPDMWGHRGFAREVAAMLKLPLKPLEDFIINKPVTYYDQRSKPIAPSSITVDNQAPQACKRFAALYAPQVNYTPTQLPILFRLCRIDARPLDALVDATNYVMFDLGQPMHAFDAQAVEGSIGPRFAKKGEKLQLLDGVTIELTPDDLVIADSKKPLALAGIMGGAQSGVQPKTMSLLLEAACFDPTTIRLSGVRHKVRTEASARFEKSLDPHQATIALMRYVRLLQDANVSLATVSDIVAVGHLPPATIIKLSHATLEHRLGLKINPELVHEILQRLEFVVEHVDGVYTITVPTFRATKDVAIKEDIIEEVGRSIGYRNIKPVLPVKQVQASDLVPVMRLRAIKRFMASTMKMRELYNYALYDEEFLRELQWEPANTLYVKDPVSEHWRRPVTSLAPHLIKAVARNSADHEQLRFFEWGRTWHTTCPSKLSNCIEDIPTKRSREQTTIHEQKILAAILYHAKEPLDFYTVKSWVQQLCDTLKLDVTWRKVDQPEHPWVMPFQTAEILHNNNVIGAVGMGNPLFLRSVLEGHTAFVKLDGDYLLSYDAPLHMYKAASKYPDVVRDISILIPISVTAVACKERIAAVDPRIAHVELLDFFEKAEWRDQRALTFRCTIEDYEKTLTKQEVDTIIAAATASLQSLGAVIR